MTPDATARRIAELGDLWPKVPAHLRTQVAREVERVYLLVRQLGTRPCLEAEEGCLDAQVATGDTSGSQRINRLLSERGVEWIRDRARR